MYAELFSKFLAGVSCVIGLTYCITGAAVAAERQHGAHVHGEGALNVAINGEIVVFELISPAANIVGFEHMPGSEAEEQTFHNAVEQLRQAEQLVIFPENTGCRPIGVSVNGEVVDHVMEEHGHDAEVANEMHEGDHHHDDAELHTEHDPHEGHDSGHEHSHSDITVLYEFNCSSPDRLTAAKVRLFERFPGFAKIFVQVIGPNGQTAATLTSAESQISF